MTATPKATFLSLPTELRLQIAAYALEQTENVGILERRGNRLDTNYSAASNLSVLLVCRQFHIDFTNLAYQLTRFILVGPTMRAQMERSLPLGPTMQGIYEHSNAKLRNLRRLVIQSIWEPLARWDSYPFDKDSLHLDELGIVTDDQVYKPVLGLLRRLKNVKTLRIFPMSGNYRILYGRLVGSMQKDDHYQRYDAPDAPNIGNTWWEPSFNAKDISFDLVAREPEPLIAEEDYMTIMKPKVDDLMEWLARWM